MKRADEDLPDLTDAEIEEQEARYADDAAALRQYEEEVEDDEDRYYEVATGVESRGW